MKWDAVLKVTSDLVAVDPVLVQLFTDPTTGRLNFRMTGTGKHQAPLLEFMLIADSETELWAPCTVQFDMWALSMEALIAAEHRLRRLFHTELPVSFGGISMWGQWEGGDPLTVPDRDNYYGRAVRFRFTPLRELYEVGPTL